MAKTILKGWRVRLNFRNPNKEMKTGRRDIYVSGTKGSELALRRVYQSQRLL